MGIRGTTPHVEIFGRRHREILTLVEEENTPQPAVKQAAQEAPPFRSDRKRPLQKATKVKSQYL